MYLTSSIIPANCRDKIVNLPKNKPDVFVESLKLNEVQQTTIPRVARLVEQE